MKPRLNIVTVGANNLKQSREFYRRALSWEPAKGSDENIVFYDQSGIVFALYPLDKLAEDAEIPADRSGFSGVTLAINLESKDAVDQLYKQVIENGGKSLVEPRKTFWGGYDCYFADPDGHSWEIAWAPFWKFDDNGSLILE
ncbi:VOC family protein [Sunxiuqinia indica]|uniref:VOC family protein n=1 Tax=Sunxiuqinia indica TaxID=2692584 RepID=UPI00135A177C|nr:VOC family protein [Sunxiuqinia indica]